MIDIEFIFETLVIATILTIFFTAKNFDIRRKMNERLGPECKEKMSFFFKHPLLMIIANFGAFILITALVKTLYYAIFK